MKKKAIVVEGGAMRSVFSSGVLDHFLNEKYMPYDFAIGVSAGASNLVGYLAKNPHRSINIINSLATSKRFFDPLRFIKGGNLIDIKWLVEESNRLFPFDEDTLFNTIPFFATTTNVCTGKADYYQISKDNFNNAIEATAALPIAYKPTPCFSGGCYTDGGIADSIPVREAYRRGAKDITVILSQPLNYEKNSNKTTWVMKKMFSHYPNMADAILHRADNYNASLEFIKNPPSDVSIKIITPPEKFPVKRLTMNKTLLMDGYKMGIQAGQQHLM